MNPRISDEPPNRRPLRVLMTADTVGGVWTYSLILAHELSRWNVEVCLATMGAPLSKAQELEASRIRNLTIEESRFKLEWMEDPWRDVEGAGEWLLSLEEQFLPHVIHLNSFVHGNLPWRAPVLMVGHSCVYSWWKACRGGVPGDEWSRYFHAVRKGLRAADHVVAPSQTMLDSLVAEYGPLHRTQVIYNGCAAGEFKPAEKCDYVIAAGRVWDEGKNIRMLCEAAKGLPWPVKVAGDATQPDGGRSEPDGVELLGKLPREELAGLLAHGAIYALPARYEPFGLSILEAALCGCALVLGDIPTLREIWKDAAVYVSPDDPEALRANICSLISDSSRRGKLAEAARRRAHHFGAEPMASKYVELYHDLYVERLQSREMVEQLKNISTA